MADSRTRTMAIVGGGLVLGLAGLAFLSKRQPSGSTEQPPSSTPPSEPPPPPTAPPFEQQSGGSVTGFKVLIVDVP